MLNWIKAIVFIFITGVCFGQKPMVQLIVDPKIIQPGEEFTVTVKSNVDGKLDIDLPPAFVQGYNVMSASQSEMDYNTGKVIQYHYLSQNGTIGKEGTFVIGPAYIKKGRKVYKSNTVSVKVEKEKATTTDDISARQLRKPAFGIIEKSKTKIYEGEPVVLSAKVYSRFNPTHLEEYQAYELDGTIEKHPLGGGQQIMVDEKNFKGIQMYYFEYDKQLIFPAGTGKIAIDPFKMNLKKGIDGYSFTSSGSFIEVLPLPASPPKDFIGGVGKFSFTRSIDKKAYKQGDVMVMTIVVSGEGNLHNINDPKLILPKGIVQYGDPVIEDDYSFGSNGTQGKMIYKFNLQLMEDGQINIPPLTLSYFDVIKQQYVTLSEKGEQITVSKNSKFTVAAPPVKTQNTSEEAKSLSPLKTFSASNDRTSGLSTPLYLIALISPFGLMLLLIFFKKKKEENADKLEEWNRKKQMKNDAWKELEKAEQAFHSGDTNEFYMSVQLAVFKLCSSELRSDSTVIISKQELFSQLKEQNLPESTIEEINTLFKSCEEARYGLGMDVHSQEMNLQTAKKLMAVLSDQLKGKR